MTKREMFEKLINVVEGADVAEKAELIEGLNHEIELVSKKRTSLTKTQKDNLELVEIVYDALAKADKAMNVAEVYEAVKADERFTSVNKVSALITKLKNADRVERIEDSKKKVYFKAI